VEKDQENTLKPYSEVFKQYVDISVLNKIVTQSDCSFNKCTFLRLKKIPGVLDFT